MTVPKRSTSSHRAAGPGPARHHAARGLGYRRVPGHSGQGPRTPVIMVTAKTSEIDTVVGLEVGADDYVAKPYRLRELVARMRAVLRRSPPAATGSPRPAEVLEVGDLASTRNVMRRTSAEGIVLPLKEFELLELLMANPGGLLTRESLIDRVWAPDYVGDTKTLDVHVKRLRAPGPRRRPGPPRRITTVRGLGTNWSSRKQKRAEPPGPDRAAHAARAA